jgi:hypothetical protein
MKAATDSDGKAATDSDGKAASHSDPKRPLFQRSELAGVIVAVG